MRDTEIDFMDYDSAREYVLAFVATLKRTQKARGTTEEELTLWQRRAKLAESRGEPVLARAAGERVAELEVKRQQLQQEEADLRLKVDVLKEKLAALERRSGMRVDTDALVAEMELLLGEKDELKAKLDQEQANQALEDLKRKMKGNGDG
jgi:phage shock protein A